MLSIGTDTIVFIGKLVFGLLIMMVTLFFLLAEVRTRCRRSSRSATGRIARARVGGRIRPRVPGHRIGDAVSAIAKDLLAGIGFYFCGLSSVALLTLLTMVLALVPFTGAEPCGCLSRSICTFFGTTGRGGGTGGLRLLRHLIGRQRH